MTALTVDTAHFNALRDLLTYKCVEMTRDVTSHDLCEKFSCVIDQTLCVDVVTYQNDEETFTVLEIYDTTDAVYNLTHLNAMKFTTSRKFEVVDFEDAMHRICDVIRRYHNDAV